MSVDAVAQALLVAAAPAQQGMKVATKVADSNAAGEGVEMPTQPPSPQQANDAVRAAARQIDSYLKSVGREVEFRVDEDTGMTVVTVRETATGDVIRQIPNEEVLQLARRLEAGSGTLLDLTV